MTTEIKQTKKKAEQHDIKPNVTLKELVISSTIGIVSGMGTLISRIRSSFEPEVIHWPGIDKYTDKAGETQPGLYPEHGKNLKKINLDYLGEGTLSEHMGDLRTQKRSYNINEKQFLYDKYKIRSEGVKGISWLEGWIGGTIDRARTLGPRNWWQIGAASTSIAIVVGFSAYNLLTGIATRNKTKKIEDLLIDKLSSLPSASDTNQTPTETIAARREYPAAAHSPNNKVTKVASHQKLAADPQMTVGA